MNKREVLRRKQLLLSKDKVQKDNVRLWRSLDPSCAVIKSGNLLDFYACPEDSHNQTFTCHKMTADFVVFCSSYSKCYVQYKLVRLFSC